MFDDDVTSFSLQRPHHPQPTEHMVAKTSRKHGVTSYRPARFPTANIVTPIVLMYGDVDSLVDIDAMRSVLPAHTVAKRLRGYEHLDIIWGKSNALFSPCTLFTFGSSFATDVGIDVIPHVLKTLGGYSGKTDLGSYFQQQGKHLVLSDEKLSGDTSETDDF